MAKNNAAPTIIKRKKIVAGGGHHGGAWKVAYADFVTAMMAFFLLMWLLNATTEQQRQGLADYFSPALTISQVSAGGERDLQGRSVFHDESLVAEGRGAISHRATSQDKASGSESAETAEQDRAFSDARDALLDKLVESPEGNSLLPHISARVSDEGFEIELKDRPGAPLFEPGGKPTETLEAILWVIGQMSGFLPNDIAIESHVSGVPIVRRGTPAWDESRARTETVHRVLRDNGLEDAQVARLTSHGDREPKLKDRMHPANNRIDIIYLR